MAEMWEKKQRFHIRGGGYVEEFRTTAWRTSVRNILQKFCLAHSVQYKQGMNEVCFIAQFDFLLQLIYIYFGYIRSFFLHRCQPLFSMYSLHLLDPCTRIASSKLFFFAIQSASPVWMILGTYSKHFACFIFCCCTSILNWPSTYTSKTSLQNYTVHSGFLPFIPDLCHCLMFCVCGI